MTCWFLDTLTLKTLIAPATEEAFRSHHWEKAPLVVQRNRPSYYGDLFTLEDFDREMASAPADVTTAKATSKLAKRYERKTSSLPLERILSDMREGATLVLNRLHRRERKLGLLCRLLEQQLGHHFFTNLYLTPAHGQGFTPHWDNHDVFILQVLGSKHWKIEKRRRKLPGKDEHMEGDRELVADADSFTVNQGDIVYIPRGFVHAAECGSEPSLHITLGLGIYTWEDLLKASIRVAVANDERLRHALPFGFLRSGRDDLVKKVMTTLHKIANDKYLGTVVDRFKDDLVTRSNLDISGQVTAFLQATQLTGEDRVGPRPGIVYRLHIGDDTVRLNFGGRTITFPDFFKEPLGFALGKSAYAISDIAGDLANGEKIVFIERLMQEGLVIRK